MGKAAIRRRGSHLSIIGSGIAVRYASDAAEILEKEGIAASVRKTHRAVIVNDGYRNCSFASELVATIVDHAFDYLDAPIARVTCDDVPIPCAANLEAEVLVSVDKIAAAVRALAVE